MYINDVRCILSDLTRYNVNLITDDSNNRLVSHIVFSKLPQLFKQEIVRKLNNNYPSISEIFDNYADVIKTINMNQSKVYELKKPEFPSRSFELKPVVKASNINDGVRDRIKTCKFCNCTGHSLSLIHI